MASRWAMFTNKVGSPPASCSPRRFCAVSSNVRGHWNLLPTPAQQWHTGTRRCNSIANHSQPGRIDDPVIYLTLHMEDMSQSRYAPRTLDTQGRQGKEGRVLIFPSSHSKRSPLSIDDCRSVPALKARNARMQNSLDRIVPSYYSRARSRELAKLVNNGFGTTLPGSRISSLEEHHAGPTQEDCQQLDASTEPLFTTAACTCDSPIGFEIAILSL
jgi:hypothetical protein